MGPGTWINQDPQTHGTTKVVISGQVDLGNASPGMTIKRWGQSSASPGEEVPLFLVLDRSQPNMRFRGFAIWEVQEGWNSYAIITFEKSGLRLETICITRQPLIYHYSTVYKLSRIQ